MFNSAIEKIKQFIKRPFVKDLFGLQINQFFYVLVVGVASILLVRLLGKNDYGVYVLAFSLASVFTRFMQLGNAQTLITLIAEAHQARSQEKIMDAVGYFTKINLILLLPFGLASIMLAGPVSIYFYHNANLAVMARLIIVASIVGGVWQLVSVLFQATRYIKALVTVEMVDIFFKKAVMVFAAFFGFGVLGVVWGNLVGTILSLIFAMGVYYIFHQRDQFLPSLRKIVNSVRTASMKKYFLFDLGVSFDAIVSSFFGVFPPLLIGMVGQPGDVAVFSVAFAYMGLGGLLLSPIARLLSVRLPQFYVASERPWLKFMQASFVSGAITFVLAVFLFVIAPYLLPFLYGKQLVDAALISRMFFVYSAVTGLSIGMGAMIRALRRNVFFAVTNIFYLVLEVVSYLFLVSHRYGVIQSMIMTLTAYQIGVIPITFLFLYYFHRIHVKVTERIST